ncbi:MAG: hypothetical protein PHH86_11825, partial [Sphaerochaetaceae bacterium]|nr:hypothetical protein [Sphaerochaetaceae bacterium]
MREVPKLTVDVNVKTNRSVTLLPGCIPGATPYHHSVMAGSTLTLEPGPFHHILILISGDVQFSTDGNSYIFRERVSFVPNPKLSVDIKGLTDCQLLEIRWDWQEGDDELAAEYKTQFPHIQIYRNAKQYRDRNKSEKTISRSVIDQRIIPRFAFGSVETYCSRIGIGVNSSSPRLISSGPMPSRHAAAAAPPALSRLWAGKIRLISSEIPGP